jgi:hypothetical protein
MPFPPDSGSSAPSNEVVVLTFDSRRIARTLAGLASVLIIVGVATSFAYEAVDRRHDWWFRFVDVNGEGNLPAWFSVLLLVGAALLLLAVGRVRRLKGLELTREWSLLGWFVIAMSLDEMTSLHEAVGGWLDEHVSFPMIDGYAWIVPGAVVACGVAVVFARVLRSLPGHTQFAIVASGGVFLTGALGLEVIEAILTNQTGTFGTGPKLVTGAQELCEMLGIVLFIRTLLRELRRLSSYVVATGGDAALVAGHAA